MLHDFLKSMDIEILACDFHRLDSWWNFERVNSPFSRLYFITEGEAFVTHNGREFKLTQGTVHLIPCFTFCDLKCPEKFAHYHISFISRIPGGADVLSLIKCDFQYQAGKAEKEYFKRLFELNQNHRLQELDPYRQLKQEVQRTISGELMTDMGGSEILETDGIMRLLLAPLLRNSKTFSRKKSVDNFWLQEILTYIEEHFHEDITLKTLASRVALHPTYFSDLFFRLTGVRPIAYIARKRIDKSQMLLLGSNKSIKEIAFECGFRSVSYYNRSFKKAFHISPGEFRASTES